MNESDRLNPKPVAWSMVREQVYKVFPNDLNQNDTVFGGLIMAIMDRVSSVAAERHAGSVTVTVGVDAVHFLRPAVRGDTLIFNISVNRAWHSSMEIGCRVEAESVAEPARRHILSAYSTFVAMDEQRRPREVAPVIPETDEQRRRYDEADLRRANRLRHAEELKQLRTQRGEPA